MSAKDVTMADTMSAMKVSTTESAEAASREAEAWAASPVASEAVQVGTVTVARQDDRLRTQVAVVGAGISGYYAALALRRAGLSVTLLSKGLGGLSLSPGTLDVLGRLGGSAGPARGQDPADLTEVAAGSTPRLAIEAPLVAFGGEGLLSEGHPYLTIGADHVRRGVEGFLQMVGEDLLEAPAEPLNERSANHWLPTAVGAIKPSLILPPSMRASALADGGRYLVVGLRRLKDFHAELIAGNLGRTPLPGGGTVSARAITIDLEVPERGVDISALTYARALDSDALLRQLAEILRPHVEHGETVLMPAILGESKPRQFAHLALLLGTSVGEVPMAPPSVPGIRLEQRLARRCSDERVRVIQGARVTGAQIVDGRVRFLHTAAAGRPVVVEAEHVIFATGGFESGALVMESDGTVRETLLDLPLAGVSDDPRANLQRLIHNDYWGNPQGLFRVGLQVDAQMRPLGADGKPVYEGLHAVGGLLAGAVRWAEYSGEGIALGSAHAAVEAILATDAAS